MADKVTNSKTLGVIVEYFDLVMTKKTATFKLPNFMQGLTESEVKTKFTPYLNMIQFEDEHPETPAKTILSAYVETEEKVSLDIGWKD